MKNNHILILGGARSGKSAYAEKLALSAIESENSQKIAYIATARKSSDKEMQQRIAKHIQRRGDEFITYEEEFALDAIIKKCAKIHDIILIDCLTLWLSNLFGNDNINMNEHISNLQQTLISLDETQVIMVSNEVGLGIVPNNALARKFIDEAGILHQELAQICSEVYFVTAGLPLTLKSS